MQLRGQQVPSSFSAVRMSEKLFAQDMPCSSTPPHPVLRVARGEWCLTAPALNCSVKLDTSMPTEVLSSGKNAAPCSLGFVFTVKERNNAFPSLFSCLFLLFQGQNCYPTVTECVCVWRTGLAVAHLEGFGTSGDS